MLAVDQQPGNISLSRNQIIWKLMAADSGGNPYTAIGVRSEVRTSGFFSIGTGDTLIVNYTEPDDSQTSITFTGAVNPSTELEIPSDEGQYTNFTEYYQAVADKIAAHHLIGPHFKLYTVFNGTGQSLWIEALEINNDWAVTFDITGLSNPSFSVHHYTTFTPTTLPDNHKVLLDIFLEENLYQSDYYKAASLEAKIDSDGNVVFDIQDILHAELKTLIGEPFVPTNNGTGPFKADVLRKYYVRYREEHDSIINATWTVSSTKKVLCGGVDQGYFSEVSFFDSLNAENSLLTWYPDGKTVSPDQPEHLAWFNYTGGVKQVVVELKTYTADSTTPTTEYKYTRAPILSVEDCEVLIVPLGYTQLGIGNTDVVKYSIQLVDASSDYTGGNTTYLSQIRNYYVDRYYYLEKRFLTYFNSFCVPETLRCVGELTKDLEVSRETSQKILTSVYQPTDKEVFQHNQQWSNPLTYRSGYLRKQEVEALQELLIFNEVYEIVDDTYFALHITDTKYRVTETRRFLHTIQFKAIKSLMPVSYYRKDPIVPTGSPDTNEFSTVLGDNAGNVLVDGAGNALGIP